MMHGQTKIKTKISFGQFSQWLYPYF